MNNAAEGGHVHGPGGWPSILPAGSIRETEQAEQTREIIDRSHHEDTPEDNRVGAISANANARLGEVQTPTTADRRFKGNRGEVACQTVSVMALCSHCGEKGKDWHVELFVKAVHVNALSLFLGPAERAAVGPVPPAAAPKGIGPNFAILPPALKRGSAWALVCGQSCAQCQSDSEELRWLIGS